MLGSVVAAGRAAGLPHDNPIHGKETVGWEEGCAHAGAPVPATVFDPFAGSGTTLLVAQNLGRSGVGLELSAPYIALAQKRLAQTALL